MHDDHPDAFQRCDFETREEMETNLKVGSTVLIFDVNRRIYKKPENPDKYASGGPIHRGHYRTAKVTGETSRSWVFGNDWDRNDRRGLKVSKKTLEGIASNQCADRAGWLSTHAYRVTEALRRTKDATLVQEVAKRLGLELPDLP